MKVDVCMWAKNGAKFLPIVLKRIEKVIPIENVNQRIFVDDGSIDDSVLIARDFNWTVYPNREGFVAGGMREALRHIETDFFVSVEQDVILNESWWDRIPPYMGNDKVAIACGVRFPTHPVLRAIFQSMYSKEKDVSRGTLDNTIYRTGVVKEIGVPSPTVVPLSVDVYLYHLVCRLGYKWIRDRNVVSDHIRLGLVEEELHRHKHSMLSKQKPLDYATMLQMLRILGTSPFRGFQIALETKIPFTIIYYVYHRLKATQNYLIKRNRPYI